MTRPDLPAALSARGLVAVVGAGGKKSTLYTLARRLDRAVLTATVRIPIFDEEVESVVVTDDPVAAVEAADSFPVGVVPEREREDRYRGYDRETVADLASRVADETDAVLVKADGARTRLLKAPDDREPQIPATADTVLPIASAQVVGKPLSDKHVHRVERVAAVTELDRGDEIRFSDVAAVLASEAGGLKDAPEDATVVPVVNMVDDDALRAIGEDIAQQVLDRTADDSRVDRVVLTRMTADEPVVAVVD